MTDTMVFTRGYEIEVIGSASKVFDLERVEIEGLPVNVKIPEPKKAAN